MNSKMQKLSSSFFVMDIILLFAAIGFILAVFDLTGIAFVFEFAVLLAFIFIAVFSMISVYRNKKLGWTLLIVTFVLLMLNVLLMGLFSGAFGAAHLVTIVFTVLGLAVALFNLAASKQETEINSSGDAREYYQHIEKAEPQPQQPAEGAKEEIPNEDKSSEAEAKVAAKKSAPAAKFVGSAETKKFHAVKCNWARMLKRKNKIFFNSKRKAEKAGFKAHECAAS